MPFDYKKEYKEFYLPPKKPTLVDVPAMNFVAVRGKGDPNDPDGDYQRALTVLYSVAYTLKMSYKGARDIGGFFQYVVPPLEGFWFDVDEKGVDLSQKDKFEWLSAIRLPDFVKQDDFRWAVETASEKKKFDCSAAQFVMIDEGLCAQCMHIGSYDSETRTLELIRQFVEEQGLTFDFSETRLHHEIYLSDPRKTAQEKLKTVLRTPVKKINE
ncbi:MAG: GyrI-like domain-containing protein [Thermoguttaceae bacterium]|nr:GyrI-like domain-containing protein [Thermoguttaceae bacterium]